MKKKEQSRFDISEHISIDPNSSHPKYEQIADQIMDLIDKGILFRGQKLPPINTAHKAIHVSRDTLILAYKELQNRNILESVHGKGFYVAKKSAVKKKKVFLLFDVMNGYKEVLYRSIVEHLNNDFEVDIFFHYYRLKQFERLIFDNMEDYDYLVIMPHFNDDVSPIVSKIPVNKCILIDKDIPSLKFVPGVFQDFESDAYHGLMSGIELIKKYRLFHFISNRNFQFIPDGILRGFRRFCDEQFIHYHFIEDVKTHQISKGDLFLLFNDRDLINVIKSVEELNLKLGADVGIISYDDTSLKEVLKGGITVMSTDFHQMGVLMAELLKGNRREKIANEFSLIKRNSL